MTNLFSLDYNGPPFVLFSPLHLGAVALVIACCVLPAVVLHRWRENVPLREGLRHSLAIFSLLNLVAWQVWQISVGTWTVAYALPLHICTFSNLLCAIMLWSRSYRVFEVQYFWGFAGVIQALLTPDIGRFGFPHFVFIIFFTSHGIILAAVTFMLVAERYRPRWASVGWATAATLAFLAFVGVVNWLTGGNYMFVGYKPAFASLIDFLGPWPWYVLPMIGIGIIASVVVYLPFAIADGWTRMRIAASAS